jgi:hypothetical protein
MFLFANSAMAQLEILAHAIQDALMIWFIPKSDPGGQFWFEPIL